MEPLIDIQESNPDDDQDSLDEIELEIEKLADSEDDLPEYGSKFSNPYEIPPPKPPVLDLYAPRIKEQPVRKVEVDSFDVIDTVIPWLADDIYLPRKQYTQYRIRTDHKNEIHIMPDFVKILSLNADTLFEDPKLFEKCEACPVLQEKASLLRKKTLQELEKIYDPRKDCVRYLEALLDRRTPYWKVRDETGPVMQILYDPNQRYCKFSPAYIVERAVELSKSLSSSQVLEGLKLDLRNKIGKVKAIVRKAREKLIEIDYRYRILQPLPSNTLINDFRSEGFVVECLELAIDTSLKLLKHRVILFNLQVAETFDSHVCIRTLSTYSASKYYYV